MHRSQYQAIKTRISQTESCKVDKVIQKLKDDGTYQTYLEKAAKLTEVEYYKKAELTFNYPIYVILNK